MKSRTQKKPTTTRPIVATTIGRSDVSASNAAKSSSALDLNRVHTIVLTSTHPHRCHRLNCSDMIQIPSHMSAIQVPSPRPVGTFVPLAYTCSSEGFNIVSPLITLGEGTLPAN